MALNKYKLGELIEEITRNNDQCLYGVSQVRGLSNNKNIIQTKASVDADVIYKFLVIYPEEFVYNPRTTRMGEKVGLIINFTGKPLLFSFNNIGFAVKRKDLLLPLYLYIYFCRNEFDRYARINSWGSATELFTFEEMCDIDIELPPIEVQQKYVDIYQGMVKNQQAYERGLEDLKLVCDGYIEDLRRKMPSEPIGKYIKRYSEKNSNKRIDEVVGLSTKKEFREAQSRVNRDELAGYKVLHPLDIAFVPTTDTWKVLAFAVNHFNRDVVVSPIYEVFAVDQNIILSDYLAMWLKRDEFDRYARYNSWGSARENFSFEEMCEVRIPIPDIEIQRSISNIYEVYNMRKEINEKLKSQIKAICPILIKGSLNEVR